MALAAIRGEQALVELSQKVDLAANQIKQWKDELLEGPTGVFGDEAKAEPAGPTVEWGAYKSTVEISVLVT